jgi:hypothetical protein
MKNFYVKIDWTVSKSNPGHGFANSKKIVGFTSKAKAKAFLVERFFDLSAKMIKRSDIKVSDLDNIRSFDKSVTLKECVLTRDKFGVEIIA